MRNGLYRVQFGTPLGQGAGVVVLTDGKLRGGDSGIAYIGDYVIEGDHFSATVKTQRHTNFPGLVSVFGNDNVTINIKGTFAGDKASLTGSAPAAPGVSFTALLERISD